MNFNVNSAFLLLSSSVSSTPTVIDAPIRRVILLQGIRVEFGGSFHSFWNGPKSSGGLVKSDLFRFPK